MHQPRPYGLHVIGSALTDKDEAFISSVAVRMTNLKDLSGVDSMKMVHDLPDGGYVVIQDMGGNFRVIAHKPFIEKEDVVFSGLAKGSIPALYSGVITRSVVREGEGVGLKITEAARLRLSNYNTENLIPKDLELRRFRVDYNERFLEFKPPIDGYFLNTQYTKLRPTWYSGAMAEAMQIIGGYGRQDISNLPDQPEERLTFTLPPAVTEAVEKEIGNLRLPAYQGSPPIDGQFRYDYKFNRTDAIGFDGKKNPWLIQITNTGVWAMPLPIIPATATKSFRGYIENTVQDDEILAILNRFGALPSGEPMPTGQAMQAWIRAGVIIKVCGVSDFYDHIMYSSACGWSLNSRGDEGYNTCYDYYDDEGLGYGLTYKLKLSLGVSKNHFGETAEGLNNIMLPERVARVRQYLNELMPLISNGTDEERAILYKLRRVGPYAIHERALVHKGFRELDYWRNLELEPIATHTGSVSEVYRGYLYHPAKFAAQPQIKFPEPLLGGCVSHDFLPLSHGRYKDSYPNSDTIMFAYYIGNSLKTVKYFVDWARVRLGEYSGNFEPYMRVGNWEQQASYGLAGVQGYFYSSDIDDREVIAPKTIKQKIVGADKGYQSVPSFLFDHFFAMCGTLWRNRYYTHKTNTETVEGRSLQLAVCVPYLCRNAVIHVKHERIPQKKTSESLELSSVRDPTSYRFYTYDFVWAWTSMTIKNPKGVPRPRNGSPVWVEEKEYAPHPSYDFADNGDWIPSLPQDYTWLIHPNKNEWLNNGGGQGTPTIKPYLKTSPTFSETKGKMQVSINGQPDLVNLNVPSNLYLIGSPDDFLGVFYRESNKVVFGETIYYNVSEQGMGSGNASWGSCSLVEGIFSSHFIGVINE